MDSRFNIMTVFCCDILLHLCLTFLGLKVPITAQDCHVSHEFTLTRFRRNVFFCSPQLMWHYYSGHEQAIAGLRQRQCRAKENWQIQVEMSYRIDSLWLHICSKLKPLWNCIAVEANIMISMTGPTSIIMAW